MLYDKYRHKNTSSVVSDALRHVSCKVKKCGSQITDCFRKVLELSLHHIHLVIHTSHWFFVINHFLLCGISIFPVFVCHKILYLQCSTRMIAYVVEFQVMCPTVTTEVAAAALTDSLCWSINGHVITQRYWLKCVPEYYTLLLETLHLISLHITSLALLKVENFKINTTAHCVSSVPHQHAESYVFLTKLASKFPHQHDLSSFTEFSNCNYI